MEVLANLKTLFHKDNWFLNAYHSIRSWFKFTFNKNHIRLMKEAYRGRPWDFGYLWDLEYAKIKEMADYLEKSNRFVGVEYVVRDMRICLSLIEIFSDKRDLFHFDGKLLNDEKCNRGVTVKAVGIPDFEYKCHVNVNLKNISRFVDDKDAQKWYINYPHEFYELKARYLYHKIRREREMKWWD